MEHNSQYAQSLKLYWMKAVGIKNKNWCLKEVSLSLDQIYQGFFVILSKIKMCLLKYLDASGILQNMSFLRKISKNQVNRLQIPLTPHNQHNSSSKNTTKVPHIEKSWNVLIQCLAIKEKFYENETAEIAKRNK